MSHAKFITFEGPDGAGKTTQARLLAEWLTVHGENVLLTRQPGGEAVGKLLRGILLDQTEHAITPQAELLMMMADRSQSVATVIEPHLASGGFVICDRYADSSLAYQGYGRGIDYELVERLNLFATRGLMPAVTFLLDIASSAGLSRQGEKTRMEAEALPFHERVRAGFLAIASAQRDRIAVIDATGSIDTVASRIRAEYEARIGKVDGS